MVSNKPAWMPTGHEKAGNKLTRIQAGDSTDWFWVHTWLSLIGPKLEA
jgi:hypothetical protein